MAKFLKLITNKLSEIQSKVQEAAKAKQQQVASSTKATQSWSTTTPTVTDTPKVTSTAKAMPSVTTPDLSKIVPVSQSTINNSTKAISNTTSNASTKTATNTVNKVDINNLLWNKTQVTLKKAATPDLLNTTTERKVIEKTPISLNLVRAADQQWWAVKETVDKTLLERFTDFFNKKPDELTRKFWENVVSFVNDDLLDTSGEKPLWNATMGIVSMINDTEFWVLKLADTISSELWFDTWITDKLSTQFNYWDEFSDKRWDLSEKRYEENQTAQNIKKKISDEIWKATDDRELSDTIWGIAWRVYSAVSDPNEIAYTIWYMFPSLLATYVSWWSFWAWTASFAPSQATNVYRDFSKDEYITNNYSDTEIFTASSALWTLMAMVETLWDALWDMPWAKTFSRQIRKNITTNLRKNITKGIEKTTLEEIEKVTDKNIINSLKNKFTSVLKNWVKWSLWEWAEEVIQDTMQTEGAIAMGSKRDHMSLEDALTTFFIALWMWSIIQAPWAAINYKNNIDLKNQYDWFSETLDKVAPWINEETKQAFFSAMVTSQEKDANLSDKQISKYEEETTELYNQLYALEEEVKTTEDPERIYQIDKEMWDINNKIKEIDKKINQWNNTKELINQALDEQVQYNLEQQEKETSQETTEEPTQQKKQQLPKEVWGENLSEQTMESIDTNKPTEIAEEQEKKPVKLPSTDYDYTSLASALNQPTNTYLQDLSDEDLQKLHDTTFARWKALMDEEIYWWAMVDATRAIIRKVNEEVARREKESAEKATKKSEAEKTATKTKMKFKDAKDYIQKMIDIDKKNWTWSKSNDRHLRKSYMSDFLRTNLEWDFAAHLPWLKNVNLKQIKWNLTDKDIRDIAEMLSLVSTTLWIDFNKVIQDKDMSMNIVYDIKDFLYNTWALWLMSWKATKDMVKNLAERTGERINPSFWADLAKMWVALTLQEWPIKSAATMAHELMHLIDFALSTEEWLPLYFEKGKVTYTSIINDDSSWKTYTKGNYDKDYYNRWQEIIARYAEQYFAYKNDKELFDKFTKRTWYWTEEEFVKLLPKFESFIKNRLWAKLLDEQNQFYNEVVRKINENLFKTTQIEFAERDDMTESEVKYKLAQLESEYAWILQTVEWMKWDLKEEMEAYVQLSNIQSNYEMAKAKWEEYLEKLKTTPEQQDIIDETTTTVMPEPPQDPWTIKEWIPSFWWSNIEEWINDIADWGKWEKLWESYTKEEDIIKIRKKKNKIKTFKKELWQTMKDLFTPAISRIYNISPRVAWRLITMETQKDINIYRYRQKAKWFVESLGKLKGNNALEVKMALLDYWALASEQWENIAEYKKEEVAKLKEVLLRNWFKEKDINDMFEVLEDIWKQYKDAWLSVTLTDMYFPRVVKDYEWLIDYMNKVSWKDIKVNKVSLMIKIKNIQSDPDLTAEEKEAKIRRAISVEFSQPWTTSQHWKERKMWKLSDWWEWIFAYYESPIESIDHYIVTMTNAIQRQLFLGWMKEDAEITESDILNQDTAESVSTIIWKLVELWKINEEDIEELQKSILAVLNKKPSPKSVTALKDITYISTITNFLSAINQLDDLWMVILRDKSWLKHIVKTIFGKAWIKYDELWLEDAYEMFREEWWITNWLFKKSFFNMFDRLGKTSFVNAAWESMIHQSKNDKTRYYLYTRLQAMYWTESANRMMEKIDSGDYHDDSGQIDIEILRDLLYQLWSTQPIYTSAMPTTYLNHPRARLCYALSSFTLKRIDWLIQWTKEVNAKHWPVVAWAWLMWVSCFLAIFWAAIWDVWDLLKGKKEETFLWQLINEWIDEALAAWWSDMLDSWLKIWDLSEYDIKTYKSQWLWWVFSAKMKPFVFDLGKDIVEAITEHDLDEITDLAKYVPIFWKLTYYWLWDDLWESTKKSKSEWDFDMDMEWDFWALTDTWDWEDDEEWDFS